MTPEEAQLLADLGEAVTAEVHAREAVRTCAGRVTSLVKELQARGIPSSKIAARVARAKGEPASPADRQRIASALRQRKARATRCHRNQIEPPSIPPAGALLIARKEADIMPTPRVVKRTTVTEEFLEVEPAADEIEQDDDETDDEREPEADDAEDRRPKKRRS